MSYNNPDFNAFRAKIATGVAYETRDDGGLAATIEKIGTAFEAHKKAVDESLIEVRKYGQTLPETEAKLAKIGATLDEMGELKSRLEKMEVRASRPGMDGQNGEGNRFSPAEIEHRDAFKSWVRNSKNHAFEAELRAKEAALETRGVDTVTGGAGGFAVPEIISREITRLGVDVSPIRQIARVVNAGSPDYKELVDVNGSTFGWVGETDPRTATNTSSLAEITPTFGMAYAYPTATEESLSDMFFNVENWIITSAGETIAKGEGAAFISGDGTKKPTGFLAGPAPVATADETRAFGTLQYRASNSATAMPTSPDALIDMVQSLRARYRAGATWVTSKLVVSSLRKYKDDEGQYLWQPSLQLGQPQNFLGYPIVEAEDMPAVGANAFPLAFGDFREGYMIVDIAGMRMTRDDVTTPGYVKFYVRKRVGGKIKNSQAIKLLKIAAT